MQLQFTLKATNFALEFGNVVCEAEPGMTADWPKTFNWQGSPLPKVDPNPTLRREAKKDRTRNKWKAGLLALSQDV